ncbi:MAG TPA: NAD(P)-dependent oxidoreductase [Xanthobacteraceae bacterium]|nr:NAD(P)-dependent oxidoreductase [Xanthobacteraceae bacterium]
MTIHRIACEARPGRMGPLATLPVFLALDGKRAVLVGGSAAAAWKGELLSAAGARVDAYAEEISDELRMIAADPPRGVIVVHKRACTADDLKGAVVAVVAFEEEAGATRFAQMARTAGVPVNVVDKPALSDFTLGAIVNRSPLVIGISTDGAAPVFAQAIRAKLEVLLPRGFAAWAAAAQSWRAAVKASGLTFAARRKFWRRFTAHAMTHAESEPMEADFDRLIAGIQGHDAAEHGSVTIVNAGSADAELLTLRAVRALQSADVILFDELVSHDVLDFARREARKLLVSRSGFGRSGEQDDIDALMIGLAKKGKHVVRLKGGNPSGSLPDIAAEETTAISIAAPASSAARSEAAA